MAKINLKVLKKAASEAINNASTRKIVLEEATMKFEIAKQQMIEEFENHPVTREIEDGPEAGNSSNTLGGYGNLYSFIGFEEGAKPTTVIKDYLEKSTQLKSQLVFKRGEDGGTYHLKFTAPSATELEEATPSPWDAKSWVRGIERGISGLGYYIYGTFSEKSRSGSALQAETKLRNFGYKPVKYMSNIINNFLSRLR